MIDFRSIALIGMISLAFSGTANAQFLVFNNGAQVSVSQGCIVSILTGDLDNSSGSISNAGRITVDGNLSNDDALTGGGSSTGIFTVSGDWENNDVFTSDQSTVNLNGGDQLVTGTSLSSFYNLNLLGSGIKTLDLDAEITGDLELNDLELATQTNTLRVLNTSNSAVAANAGFVSSTSTGRLSWAMNSTDTYVFPLGSSSGTLRVRPLAISPANASPNTFEARMANVDATSEGYDLSQMSPELCFMNDLFYLQIDHTSGSDAADVTQYYDPIQDGDWANGAHWQNVPQWEDMGNETVGTSGSYSTVTNPGWADFNQPAFALANALPTVSLDAISPLCEFSDPVALNASPSGGSFFGDGVSNGMFSPTNAGGGTHTVTYTYTDTYGCTNEAEIDIEVNNAPLVTITSSNNGALELCSGETMDLTATSGFTGYEWNTSAQTEAINVSTAGQYWVTVVDANGCEGTSAVANVTVQPVPTPVATANGPLEFCEGETVTISTTANMAAYLWSGTGSITPTTVITESGDYFVTVTNQYGCEGVSNTVTVDVTPMIPAVILDNGNTLTVDPPGSGYQWFLNGDPVPGATGLTYEAIQSGNYYVEYIGANGCPTTTSVLEFTLVGIDDNSIFTMLNAYPNPGKGQFVISGMLPANEDVSIELTNMLGQRLIPTINIAATSEFTYPVDISQFANGVYFIRVRAAEGLVTIRYIKS